VWYTTHCRVSTTAKAAFIITNHISSHRTSYQLTSRSHGELGRQYYSVIFPNKISFFIEEWESARPEDSTPIEFTTATFNYARRATEKRGNIASRPTSPTQFAVAATNHGVLAVQAKLDQMR